MGLTLIHCKVRGARKLTASGILARLALFIITAWLTLPALAYPEFQAFIVKHSGRPVNCAFCHANADGPEGTAPGQIGRLTTEELNRLGQARAAFEPGVNVDSPILNPFGNHIVKSVGKKRLLEIKLAPAQLAEALPKESDLDGDGIPDAREFLAGTHPCNKNDGDPWLLFKTNLRRHLTEIVLTLAATVAGLWGLNHLLRGFAAATQTEEDEGTVRLQ